MSDSPSGWTFLKVTGFVVGLLALAGFGVCALCGVLLSASDTGLASTALPLSAIGAAVATGAFFLLRAILRAVRRDSSPPP